jgi:Tol biopolymer transport system component
MAYFVKNNENYDIYMVDFTTQIPRRLTCHEGFDGYPVFSPDSQKIYFHSDREGNYQIYSISLNQPVQKSVLIENLNEEQS